MSARRSEVPATHLLAAAFFGLWSSVNGCYTKAELCANLRDAAASMPTALGQCQQMTAYRTCVDEDLLNCTDNRYTNQYAVNLEKSYCDPAYLCVHRLKKCFENYTEEAVIRVTNTDPSTKNEACWSLVRPVMDCQNTVSADCKDQVGLLESVAKQQIDLVSLCNDTMGCVGKVIQCQNSITEAASLTDTSQHGNDSCFYNNYVDYCSAYQAALSCVKVNLTSCVDEHNFSMQGIVDTLTESTKAMCNAEETCQKEFSACLCHINNKIFPDPTSIFRVICQIYPPFQQCLNNLSPSCRYNVALNNEMTPLVSIYKPYYDLLCTPQQGLCPPAVQCLQALPETKLPVDNLANNGSDSQSADGGLDLARLCPVAVPVFDCLGNASQQCGQGQASNVTFADLKTNFHETCTEIAPSTDKLSLCGKFYLCMKEYGLGVSEQMPEAMRHLYSGLVRTDFWCSYLSKGYRCVAETAQPCGLDYHLAIDAMARYSTISKLCGAPPPVVTTKAPVPPVITTSKPIITVKPTIDTKPKGDAVSCSKTSLLWTTAFTLVTTMSVGHH